MFVAAHVGFLLVAGAVAADGVEPVVRVGAVEDFLAVDPSFEDLGVDAEGIAGEDDEVGVLAGFERADAVGEVEDFRAGEGDGLEGSLAAEAGHACRTQALRRKYRESVIQSSVW